MISPALVSDICGLAPVGHVSAVVKKAVLAKPAGALQVFSE